MFYDGLIFSYSIDLEKGDKVEKCFLGTTQKYSLSKYESNYAKIENSLLNISIVGVLFVCRKE